MIDIAAIVAFLVPIRSAVLISACTPCILALAKIQKLDSGTLPRRSKFTDAFLAAIAAFSLLMPDASAALYIAMRGTDSATCGYTDRNSNSLAPAAPTLVPFCDNPYRCFLSAANHGGLNIACTLLAIG